MAGFGSQLNNEPPIDTIGCQLGPKNPGRWVSPPQLCLRSRRLGDKGFQITPQVAHT